MIVKRRKLTNGAAPKRRVKKKKAIPKDEVMLLPGCFSVEANFTKPQTVGPSSLYRVQVVLRHKKLANKRQILFFAETKFGFDRLKDMLEAYNQGDINEEYLDDKTWDKAKKQLNR